MASCGVALTMFSSAVVSVELLRSSLRLLVRAARAILWLIMHARRVRRTKDPRSSSAEEIDEPSGYLSAGALLLLQMIVGLTEQFLFGGVPLGL